MRYDLRGHGRSGKPETAAGYTSDKFAEDFKAVMTAFGLTKPIVVGWSYGGSCHTIPSSVQAYASFKQPLFWQTSQQIYRKTL